MCIVWQKKTLYTYFEIQIVYNLYTKIYIFLEDCKNRRDTDLQELKTASCDDVALQLRLKEASICRTYTGAKRLYMWHGCPAALDGEFPEDRIASYAKTNRAIDPQKGEPI